MAGGTSIWVSSEAKTDPRAIFNLRLLYLLVAVSWGGSFYGFDTGNIGGILTLPSFKNAFGLNDVSQAEQDNRKVGFPRPENPGFSLTYTREQLHPCSRLVARSGPY